MTEETTKKAIRNPLPLKHPITLTFKGPNGEEREEIVTELSFKRLKAKMLRVMDGVKGEGSQAIALIATMTGQPIKVIDELDGEDLEAAGEVIESFFPNSPRIGKRRSRT